MTQKQSVSTTNDDPKFQIPGSYQTSRPATIEEILNIPAVKDHIAQERAALLDEVEEELDNMLTLGGVTHGRSSMKGYWVNVEDVRQALAKLREEKAE